MLGLHAENTKNCDTLKRELEVVQKHLYPLKVHSFTKHGYGNWKGGRNHYPTYNPSQYLKWSQALGIPYYFGNGTINESSKLSNQNEYYPDVFWVSKLHYAECERLALHRIIDIAKNSNVVVIIHPANFQAEIQVMNDMKKLVFLARQSQVNWITI